MIETLPGPKDVRDCLGELLGREITVSVIDPWAPLPTDYACVAEYLDDFGQLHALCLTDLPIAVFLGAAIGLVPSGGAQDMVAENRPSSMVLANLSEILNIVSALFNVPLNPHIRLGAVYDPGAVFPPDIAEGARVLAGRLDLRIEIPTYGAGRLSLISV